MNAIREYLRVLFPAPKPPDPPRTPGLHTTKTPVEYLEKMAKDLDRSAEYADEQRDHALKTAEHFKQEAEQCRAAAAECRAATAHLIPPPHHNQPA